MFNLEDKNVTNTCKWCLVMLVLICIAIPLILLVIDSFGLVNLYSVTPTP
jgi:hypothetical protein